MKIIFPIAQLQKLKAYVKYCNYEISGLGKIELINGDIYIQDVRIFQQTVSPAETKLDRRALGKFYDEIIQQEGDLSQWKLWWHSHAKMDTFFSAIDEQTIADFDNEMPVDNWMLSIVTNHAGKILARLDIFTPVRCTVPELDWDISFDNKELDISILDEVAEKVQISVFKPSHRNISWPSNGRKRLPFNLPAMTGVETEDGIIYPEDADS